MNNPLIKNKGAKGLPGLLGMTGRMSKKMVEKFHKTKGSIKSKSK